MTDHFDDTLHTARTEAEDGIIRCDARNPGGAAMTHTTPTPIETVAPAYKAGDAVRFGRGREGTITRVYPASGQPLWYGTRRLIHTHCYEIQTSAGPTWGWVDAELT